MEESDLSRLREEIRVTEDNIPGAKIVKKVEDCNFTESRPWLAVV